MEGVERSVVVIRGVEGRDPERRDGTPQYSQTRGLRVKTKEVT